MTVAGPIVLVVGHVTHDRYGPELVAGGSAYYGALTHRGLGADVRLATAVGDDFACDPALAGLACHARRAGTTTSFANDYRGDRRVQRTEGQAPAIRAADLPPGWRRCDLLHLAPVMGEVDLGAWIGAVDARLVGIAIQGWIKRAAGRAVVPSPWAIDAAALAGVNAACLGEEDLRDQGDLLDRLVAAIPIVALTRGRAGCDVIVRGRTTRVGIHPARELDPTGAGDAFAAGFLLSLARGRPAIEAAQVGAAAASIVVEGRAGDALPRVPQAWRRAPHVPTERASAPARRKPGA